MCSGLAGQLGAGPLPTWKNKLRLAPVSVRTRKESHSILTQSRSAKERSPERSSGPGGKNRLLKKGSFLFVPEQIFIEPLWHAGHSAGPEATVSPKQTSLLPAPFLPL